MKNFKKSYKNFIQGSEAINCFLLGYSIRMALPLNKLGLVVEEMKQKKVHGAESLTSNVIEIRKLVDEMEHSVNGLKEILKESGAN